MSHDSASQPLLGQNGEHHHRHQRTPKINFTLTPQDLAPLTDPTAPKLPRELFGGTDKLCEGLRVKPKDGLNSDEGADSLGHSDHHHHRFEDRSEKFGRNVSLFFAFSCLTR